MILQCPKSAVTDLKSHMLSAVLCAAAGLKEKMDMITEHELQDERTWKEIKDDIEQEAKAYGRVRQVVLPRLGGRRSGVGRAFIEYEYVRDAQGALGAMNGRSFGPGLVEARFYDERRFASGEYAV